MKLQHWNLEELLRETTLITISNQTNHACVWRWRWLAIHFAQNHFITHLCSALLATIVWVSQTCMCIAAMAMAMATLSLVPSLPCGPSLRLRAAPATSSTSRLTALLKPKGFMNATSLILQTIPGASKQASTGASKQALQRRRLICQAGSVDKNDVVAAGEQKLSETKESVSEKQGPPFATIIAGIVVAVLVVWGLWSVVSAILGIFFH
ncbi:hypothetical protein KC19_12G040200 [Ceratodon purpureus]|uniref:Uncharacterized protein n=1 Tax=Ceratodon purpureus TaxID=3225 RepID=A0A8T0G4K5_CERPU|nr:hypothetical protein KC19_12G040200 [Ceratodon purpureus]